VIAVQRRILILGNLFWFVRRYVDRYGWRVLFQKAIARFVRLRRRMINRLAISRILFGWRNTLLRKKPIQVKVGGSTFFIAPRGQTAFDIWAHLRFERHEIEFVTGFLQECMVFLDIGSNAGVFALSAARKFEREGGGTVYAFEPASSTFQLLKENVHINRLSDLVAPVRTALGDYVGTAILSVNAPGRDGLNTLGRSSHPDSQVVAQEQVPITILDTWLVESGIGHVDFIKMDIEGAELKALGGAIGLLQRPDAPVVFYESATSTTAGFNYHPVEIIWLLEEYGYQVYFFDQGRIIPRLARQYNGMMVAAKPTHLPSLRNYYGGIE
jgi:FkbM family methyltransferase